MKPVGSYISGITGYEQGAVKSIIDSDVVKINFDERRSDNIADIDQSFGQFLFGLQELIAFSSIGGPVIDNRMTDYRLNWLAYCLQIRFNTGLNRLKWLDCRHRFRKD